MKHATFSFLITLLLFSCKPDKTEISYCKKNPNECSNIQEIKNYFFFNLGSWWVYEEVTSGVRDSVYVTEATNTAGNYNFDVRVYSSYQDYYYHYYPYFLDVSDCNQNSDIYKKCVIVNRSKYRPGDFVGEGNCFFYKFKVGEVETTFNTEFANNKIIIEDIQPSYQLGNFIFEETVKIHELNTYMEGIQPTNHFFSKGVGLIRKELLDSNQVWNLVSYHIEP